jgi:hypothetical protein
MTVAEFLEFDDGTDTRYELVDGVPVAMSPPAGRHVFITSNVLRAPGRLACDGHYRAGDDRYCGTRAGGDAGRDLRGTRLTRLCYESSWLDVLSLCTNKPTSNAISFC